jgi:hypothetical protein
MALLKMASNHTYLQTVDPVAVFTRSLTLTPLNYLSRFFAPIKSPAAFLDSLAHLAYLDSPSAVGSKKESSLPDFSTTLVAPDPQDPEATALELDELWSFVLKSSNKRWIWIALWSRTPQVVA